MTTITADVPTTRQPDRLAGAVTAISLVAALGCAAYVLSVVVTPGLSTRQAMLNPFVMTANAIAALGFVALAVTLPGLVRGVLPRWVGYLTGAFAVFVAVVAWSFTSLGPHTAGLVSDAEMDSTSIYFALLQLPKRALSLIALGSLAVLGWRRRAFARGAAILLLLAALVSLVVEPYPPGALLTALGLAWAARTLRTIA